VVHHTEGNSQGLESRAQGYLPSDTPPAMGPGACRCLGLGDTPAARPAEPPLASDGEQPSLLRRCGCSPRLKRSVRRRFARTTVAFPDFACTNT
jgi:hypothetical protein